MYGVAGIIAFCFVFCVLCFVFVSFCFVLFCFAYFFFVFVFVLVPFVPSGFVLFCLVSFRFVFFVCVCLVFVLVLCLRLVRCVLYFVLFVLFVLFVCFWFLLCLCVLLLVFGLFYYILPPFRPPTPQRCREDKVLVEALPDTLELLLRASMEGLNLAGERAKRKAIATTARNVNGGATCGPIIGGGGGGGASSGGRSATSNGWTGRRDEAATAAVAVGAVSELELARAVMSDCVYLAQLVPECFHEVIARVARKAEPERYGLLFPMHLVADGDHGAERKSTASAVGSRSGGDGVGGGDGTAGESVWWRGCRGEGGWGGEREGAGLGPSWGHWVHPTHLFHECISAERLTTAAWYLPLIRDDVAYDTVQR